MKTLYDLETEEIQKYKEEFKSTAFGKRENKEKYTYFYILFTSLMVFLVSSIFDSALFDFVVNVSEVVVKLSLVLLILKMLSYEMHFVNWINVSLKEKKKTTKKTID